MAEHDTVGQGGAGQDFQALVARIQSSFPYHVKADDAWFTGDGYRTSQTNTPTIFSVVLERLT